VSAEITTQRPVRAPERVAGARPAPHLPGEEGLWVFIIGDLIVFGLFFGVLVVERAADRAGFAAAQAHLHVPLGLLNTLVLLTGSWLVAKGMKATYAGTRRRAWWFAGALATAVTFAGVKVVEYTLLISQGHHPAGADFFMYYFVFTGIHLVHLLIGSVLLVCLYVAARNDVLTRRRHRFMEAGAVYWHMVDMLWLVLFPLLYILR